MTESNEPEKKDETAEPTEDDPIIELKDEMAVDPADDDETVDLTEIVEESPAEDKDETVEAGTDTRVSNEAPLSPEPEEALKGDEEIIDLLQAVEEPVAIDTKETVSEDEAIIDLTETAGETPLEIEDIGEPLPEDFDMATEFDDISELDRDLIQEATDAADEPDSKTMVDDVLKDDFADSLGIELDSEEDAQKNLFDADKVTGEQVEAALEGVIKKMFYEKIDRLLVDTIEKTVTREIERLKKALLDDATDSEK